jgi:hypothetical protein
VVSVPVGAGPWAGTVAWLQSQMQLLQEQRGLQLEVSHGCGDSSICVTADSC